MGLVYADITLSNPSLETLQPLTVTALVDSAAGFLCIPRHVALQLQIKELHQREVTLANDLKQLCPYVGPVHVKYKNRECMVGALVLGESVLLGALPMEDMDLQIDPRSRQLVVNPANPNIPMAIVM